MFDDLKKTISNTMKNSTSPSPTSQSTLAPPPRPRSTSPSRNDATTTISRPKVKQPNNSSTFDENNVSPSRDGNVATEFSSSSSSTTSTTSSSGSQIKTVKTLVSKFTTQLQTAASSKNANEFIDLLARFSSEYASVMKNEETSQIPNPVVFSSFRQQEHQTEQPQHQPQQQLHQQLENSPTVHKQSPTFIESPFSSTPDIKEIARKTGENVQLIREMQEMAAALKTKARQSSVDRDIKIMQISEDILTVLKAQYQADMKAIQEQSGMLQAQLQEQHKNEMRSSIERYERRIQEMTVQYETTTQQMRERMLSGAGSSDDVKRENTQLRTQLGSLQAELRALESKLASSEDTRKEKRRQDLLRMSENPSTYSENSEKVLSLEKEVSQLRDSKRERDKEWELKLVATKEAYAKEIEKKEKEFAAKIQEMDNLNRALRSSIQQMQQLHKKS